MTHWLDERVTKEEADDLYGTVAFVAYWIWGLIGAAAVLAIIALTFS